MSQLEKLICENATTTAGSESEQFQYGNAEVIHKEGVAYCKPYGVQCVPFANGCACKIEDYRKARIKMFAGILEKNKVWLQTYDLNQQVKKM